MKKKYIRSQTPKLDLNDLQDLWGTINDVVSTAIIAFTSPPASPRRSGTVMSLMPAAEDTENNVTSGARVCAGVRGM